MGETQSIVAQVLDHAVRTPGKIALMQGSEGLCYDKLWHKIRAAATVLRSSGARAGDRVVLAAMSSPLFVSAYFATHLIGAIAVPVDPRIAGGNLQYIVDAVDARVVLAAESSGIGHRLVRLFAEIEEERAECQDYDLPSLESVADILFTTGTTGRPKGVILTHGNVVAQVANINSFIGNTPEDRECVPLPLSHSFGLGRLRCNMSRGAGLILSDGFLSASRLFQAIDHWHATGFATVPAGLIVLFRLSGDRLGEYADQMRYLEIGSAPLSIEHKNRLARLLPNTRLCMHYGLTEASRAAFIEFHESPDKLDTVGRASPNVQIRIVAEEGECELGEDQVGEILVRGGMVMKGYWKDEERTRNAFLRGWLRTGDIGSRDGQGFIRLRGRKSDLINVGGLKVAPVEVEGILSKHPSVQECACVGVEDPREVTGQTVKAFLISKPGAGVRPEVTELVEFLRGQLEEYKIPTIFEWVENIPKTPSGKISRQLLV